tara:strand:+ start:1828 stop:2781 length:954 start_codon:yes stop_codon:yes gene_type:complete
LDTEKVNILIIGGLGYLGGRLKDKLYSLDHQIFILTRQFNKNLSTKGAQIISYNWSDYDKFLEICNDIDIIIYSAGPNSYESEKNYNKSVNYIKKTTSFIIRLLKEKKNKRLIYFSTIHVYSKNLKGVIRENNDTLNNHPYALTKLIAEKMILESINKYELKINILRLSNAVGAPSNKDVNCWHLVANDFAKQALQNSSIKINAIKNNIRDFFTINYLCDLIDYLIKNPDYGCNIMNIGSGESKSILSLANLLRERAFKLFKIEVEIIENFLENNNQEDLIYTSNCKFFEKFNKKDNFLTEIDNLLLFCRKNFNKQY